MQIHTRHFTFFSFYLFITTVEIIKLEQHRGTVEEKIYLLEHAACVRIDENEQISNTI